MAEDEAEMGLKVIIAEHCRKDDADVFIDRKFRRGIKPSWAFTVSGNCVIIAEGPDPVDLTT